ncbi:MAG: transglutaminase domain-containing protein [Phycisphaerales bacterium]|nr:MAG: transglutaminase domain-containing protein [Phycisphaerales bacterium]
MARLIGLSVCLLGCMCAAGAADSDGDGLSDFQEVHKYCTDPAKRDSDGDGVCDGDWNERREYTYSVRSILQFMPPFDEDCLNDDFQDARVLQRRDDYVEVEVVHYPLAAADGSIEENVTWQRDYAGMTEYLKPGVTTNWDAKMRRELLAELKAEGIIIETLTDKEVVEKVSSWLQRRSRSLNKVFTTYYVHFPNGRPSVYPGLEIAFEGEFDRDKDNYDWAIDRHFDHEVLGKGMFYHRTHGACTSFAVYQTTVLRALGIPARMIIVIPAVDPSDERQVRLVREHITHNQVRETMMAGLRRCGQGFTAHTFNEVYVGNRWHRLNYGKLGQPILDRRLFGLQTHLYTFNDLSEADLAPTWGWRYGKSVRTAAFRHGNPYSAIALSDLFGCHCNIPNAPARESDDSRGSLPNIYIMRPSYVDGVFEDVVAIVADCVGHKTGRRHSPKSYYDILVRGIWNRKPGDILVLLFTLDTEERVPDGYEDILPRPWPQIEARLRQGETVELTAKARQMNVILLAVPRRDQLRRSIRQSRVIRDLEKRL